MAMNLFTMFNKKDASQTEQGKQAQSMGGAPNTGATTPAEKLAEGMLNIRDIIAPSAIEIDFNHVKVGNTYYRTLFVSGYPRFVGANWLSPIINFDHTLDISMFYYPVKSKVILDDLRRKITELEATVMSTREKGRIMDPVVSAALEDANALQEQLVKGVEKYFQFSFYITIPADSLEELENVSSKLESTLGSLLLISKTAALQMEDAFKSTIPTGSDKLLITRNMDTTSLATTFPFTSSDLTMEEGIMYGINRHNGSLVIFDRFSMENANTVVFAKSGAGKSYFVKLEALRLMVFGAEVMIIDPEEEYRTLCEAVGGDYIDFSAHSPAMINPFDLSGIAVEGENELGQKILSLHTLFKLMLGDLNPTEEAILDRALIETYRIKGITTDPDTQMNKEPPVMEDLYKVLLGASEPEARSMAERLEKYIKGSMAGIFDQQSTIDIGSKMTVFSTKNLEETLRPIAFYIILDFIWTRIRSDLKKRILIVEEAWYLMQNEDSARFIYGIAKRARKYYLGLTTISQDVDDFLTSEYGKAIVTNSSIQILLKQHPAAIDRVAETFYLSEGEKRLLLSADLGEGLFFAGSNHVAIKVMASSAEHDLITTNPEELLKLKEEGKLKPKKPPQPTYKPIQNVDSDKYTTFDEQGKPKEGFKPGSTPPKPPAAKPPVAKPAAPTPGSAKPPEDKEDKNVINKPQGTVPTKPPMPPATPMPKPSVPKPPGAPAVPTIKNSPAAPPPAEVKPPFGSNVAVKDRTPPVGSTMEKKPAEPEPASPTPAGALNSAATPVPGKPAAPNNAQSSTQPNAQDADKMPSSEDILKSVAETTGGNKPA